AREVAIYNRSEGIAGAGCLISDTHVLTCRHVVDEALRGGGALGAPAQSGAIVTARLIGVLGQPYVQASLLRFGDRSGSVANDLALLAIDSPIGWAVPPIEFATPLRHGGKSFSVLGFPGNDPQGRNARGLLYSAN